MPINKPGHTIKTHVLTIVMVRPGQSEVDCSNEILEDHGHAG
jgi:hypothetical protein